jgi:hypothetical protein
LPLRGTTLGFLTDMDTKGADQQYPIHVVRDCCTEALMRGFNLVGNEFNIIAGRFYGAKAGYERKVLEWPGLTHLLMEPAVPQAGNGGALVAYVATWRLNGQQQCLKCAQENVDGTIIDNRIPVKVNSGMGADAILGKAERKMYYRIYKRLSGGAFGLADGDLGDSILASGEASPSPIPAGTPEGRRISLGKGNKTKGAAAPVAESAPPPGAPAESKAAAPAERKSEPPKSVGTEALHELLASVDDAWSGRGLGKVIDTWTDEQRAAARKWATAVAMNSSMAEQAARPEHTYLERDPGEEG